MARQFTQRDERLVEERLRQFLEELAQLTCFVTQLYIELKAETADSLAIQGTASKPRLPQCETYRRAEESMGKE